MKNSKLFATLFILTLCQLGLVSCATGSKGYVFAMSGGAVVGAAAGSQMGPPEDRSRNSIIGALVGALAAGGLLAWHHREMEEQMVEISGRYARYRLCDPNELGLRDKLVGNQQEGAIFQVTEEKTGRLAISLDDETKWTYPVFRKRYLMPEIGENQMVSKRYIWEILRPGSFISRSQHPEYFVSTEGPACPNVSQ